MYIYMFIYFMHGILPSQEDGGTILSGLGGS